MNREDVEDIYNYKNIKYKRKPKTNSDDRFNILYNNEFVHRNLDRNLAYSLLGQLKNDINYQYYLLKIVKIK